MPLDRPLNSPDVSSPFTDGSAAARERLRLIAFYLPQFHPISENDEWWGKGFTEWTNVTRARPQFRGHYQPHLPADLGFYDLRLPETRQAQADLAQAYGVGGFCYYHYWFNGRRILERPFDEVLRSKSPNFPFCLCWANEPWSRNWDGGNQQVLLPQDYSREDDERHINWLMTAFEDQRYIRVDGKPVLLIYRASHLPNPAATIDLWRTRVRERGLGELLICRVESVGGERGDPRPMGFDAAVEFQPDWQRLGTMPRSLWTRFAQRAIGRHAVFDYQQVVRHMVRKDKASYPQFHCVTPRWDNSPRRRSAGVILHNSTPAQYEKWLRHARMVAAQRGQSLLFVNAWNEWAEGAHLEPDQKWGLQYLEATHRAMEVAPAPDRRS